MCLGEDMCRGVSEGMSGFGHWIGWWKIVLDSKQGDEITDMENR